MMDGQWAGPVDSDNSLLCDLGATLSLSVEGVPAHQSLNPHWAPKFSAFRPTASLKPEVLREVRAAVLAE